MGGVSTAVARATTETGRQARRHTDTSDGDVLSDIVKLTLWPENTAPCLAAACGCSVRMAERYLGGHCDWSGDAVAAVISEIMRRHGARNLKIIAKP